MQANAGFFFSVMIYVFYLASAVKADFLFFFCFSLPLMFHRGPSREGENPAECRVLPKDPQPCQRRGQGDGEPVGKTRSSLDAPIEHQLVSSKILFESAKGCYCFRPSSDSEGIPAQIGHIGTETQ